MIDRLNDVRKNWRADWKQSQPLELDEYKKHLQQLSPERLVDYLKNFQSSYRKGASSRWVGGIMTMSPLVFFGTVGSFGGRIPDSIGFAGLGTFAAGLLVIHFGSYLERSAQHNLDLVTGEVSRRLASTTQVTDS